MNSTISMCPESRRLMLSFPQSRMPLIPPIGLALCEGSKDAKTLVF